MRKVILINLILVFTLTFSCNQKTTAQTIEKEETKVEEKTTSDLPEAVKTAFEAKYPNETPDNWEIDEHGYYEFHFKKDGEKMRADFLAEGKWIETETSIKKDDLPKAIKDILKEKYDDEDIAEIEKVMHHSKGLFYDVEFKEKGKNKDIEFKADGTIIN